MKRLVSLPSGSLPTILAGGGAQTARRREERRRLAQGFDTGVSLVRGQRPRPPPLRLLDRGHPFLDGLGEEVVGQVVAQP